MAVWANPHRDALKSVGKISQNSGGYKNKKGISLYVCLTSTYTVGVFDLMSTYFGLYSVYQNFCKEAFIIGTRYSTVEFFIIIYSHISSLNFRVFT